MDRTFTLAEARALLPDLLARADAIIRLRAGLAEARHALHSGAELVALPEVKSMEAHLQEAVDWFAGHGIQLKGIAPLIADFPGQLDGSSVLLCWLEGETALTWYHRAESGFLGRRPLP